MDNNRLKHSLEVANKMIELGKAEELSKEQLQDLFLLGYIHDIGYQFGNNETHNVTGGTILKRNNYKYWKEVYYHGTFNSPYRSKYLDILNIADMSINSNGEDIGFDKRLEDIKNRYGEDSIQYKNYVKIINELRSR